jgi:hypothetical protein
MHVPDFIAKWRSADLTERATAQSHYRDLCDVLGEEAPTDAKGASKSMASRNPPDDIDPCRPRARNRRAKICG